MTAQSEMTHCMTGELWQVNTEDKKYWKFKFSELWEAIVKIKVISYLSLAQQDRTDENIRKEKWIAILTPHSGSKNGGRKCKIYAVDR